MADDSLRGCLLLQIHDMFWSFALQVMDEGTQSALLLFGGEFYHCMLGFESYVCTDSYTLISIELVTFLFSLKPEVQ